MATGKRAIKIKYLQFFSSKLTILVYPRLTGLKNVLKREVDFGFMRLLDCCPKI